MFKFKNSLFSILGKSACGHHRRWRTYALVAWLGLMAITWIAWWNIPAFRTHWVEQFGPQWWQFQRWLTGWIPFSLGDLGYIALFLWLLTQIYIFVRNWIRKGLQRKWIARLLWRILMMLSILYGIFQLGWGFAYLLPRVRQSFHVPLKPYTQAELQDLAQWLAASTNGHYVQITDAGKTSHKTYFQKVIVPGAIEAYHRLHKAGWIAAYAHPAIKPSIFHNIINYMGIEGYYNPFTGEAQVNTDIPAVLLPFVTCHEIAHQMGFAQEYAANFVGFLAATHAQDPLFRYSAYLDMLLYAANALRHGREAGDSLFFHQLWDSLLPGVKKDIQQIYAYEKRYEGPADELMMHVYDAYLRANQQHRGIHSYQQVIALLIQYRKQFKARA
ncbi:MAG: DUF3810 domain-containing protein [Thermoflavifilum sp.]|nr:DUF3810 domain-containing protein [Thermoflavifilum sp.]